MKEGSSIYKLEVGTKKGNILGQKLMCQLIRILLKSIGRPQSIHLGCLRRKDGIYSRWCSLRRCPKNIKEIF